MGIAQDARVDSDYANQPFTFTDDIPFYGKLWGKGLVTLATPVHYVIPIDKETADIAEIETKPYGFGAAISYAPYILDKIDAPSIGYPTRRLTKLPSPINSRGGYVIAEYLPGNILEEKGVDSHRYEPGDLRNYKPSFRWGEPLGPNDDIDPSQVTLDDTIPEGPMRLTMSIDGYSTDTVTLNFAKDTVVFWQAAAVPVDGMSPNASSYFGNNYRIGFDNYLPDGMMINDAGHQLLQNDEQSRSVAAPSDGIRREF